MLNKYKRLLKQYMNRKEVTENFVLENRYKGVFVHFIFALTINIYSFHELPSKLRSKGTISHSQ